MISRSITALFYPIDGSAAMANERVHYENLKGLTDKPIDVIRYLYARLNVIDSKVSSLMRLNSFSAGVLGILLAVLGGSRFTILQSTTTFAKILLLSASICVFFSFFFGYVLGELKYDHITTAPLFINQVPIDDVRANRNQALMAMRPNPKDRRFLALYDADHLDNVIRYIDQVESPNNRSTMRTAFDYEELIFKITVARQIMLSITRRIVFMGILCYSVFLIALAYDRL